MYEEQIAMIKENTDIQCLAEYTVDVAMKYMENIDGEIEVNEMISFFTNVTNHEPLWTKITAKKIKTINGKECNIYHMFTRPGQRKIENGKLKFTRGKHSRPERYGYRSVIIRWPEDQEVQNEGSSGSEETLPDNEVSDDEDTEDLQSDNQGNAMEDDLYQPRFVIVGEEHWNEYCNKKIYKTNSFNEYIRDFHNFSKDVIAVFQPTGDVQLKLPAAEPGTNLDFSGTIMPFFQSSWVRGQQNQGVLDLTHLNLNGSILDKSNLVDTRLKIINDCTMNFSILDGADLSEFTGSIFCLYPQSARNLKLSTETRNASTFLGLDESVIEVKPYLDKVGDEIKDHTTETVQSGVASVNEHVEEAKEMLSQMKTEQRSMKEETKEMLGEMKTEQSQTQEVLGEMKAEQKNMKECLEELLGRTGDSVQGCNIPVRGASSLESGFGTLSMSDDGYLSRPLMAGGDCQDFTGEIPSQISTKNNPPLTHPTEVRRGSPGASADMEDKDFLKIIKNNRTFLVQHLDMKGTALWEALVEQDVISDDQHSYAMETYHSNHEQASELIRLLKLKSKSQWLKFLECLREYDHKFVAERLEGKRE